MKILISLILILCIKGSSFEIIEKKKDPYFSVLQCIDLLVGFSGEVFEQFNISDGDVLMRGIYTIYNDVIIIVDLLEEGHFNFVTFITTLRELVPAVYYSIIYFNTVGQIIPAIETYVNLAKLHPILYHKGLMMNLVFEMARIVPDIDEITREFSESNYFSAGGFLSELIGRIFIVKF